MAQLVYSAITSLDGYVADADGNFDWAAPDAEVHQFINDLERPVGTSLLGRRMYDVMQVWETFGDEPDDPPYVRDFAQLWRAADKIVYSSTLAAVTTPRTRLEPTFDPEAVRRLKAAATRDLSIGGAELAGQAIAAGLVDALHQFVAPVVIGGGTRWLPDEVRLGLELVDVRQFASGFAHLSYRVQP